MMWIDKIRGKTKKKLVTHHGHFHADDIFACATLSLMLDKKLEKYEIIRTRDEDIVAKGDFVFDVGGIYDEQNNRFDHHQPGGAGKRSNDIDYSSFGLIWKKFGKELCANEKVVEIIDKKLVSPIDAGDNGIDLVENKNEVSPYFLQNFFSSMDATWQEENFNKNEAFMKCVEIAKTILSREIIQAEAFAFAEEKIISLYNKTEDKRIIVLDNNYPFEYVLHNFPEPFFVIFPKKDDNSWGLRVIRDDLQSFKNRKDLPEAWGGLRDEALQKITGVSDAIFCHRKLFMAVAKSKEGAIKLAQIAVESQ